MSKEIFLNHCIKVINDQYIEEWAISFTYCNGSHVTEAFITYVNLLYNYTANWHIVPVYDICEGYFLFSNRNHSR